jgi:hypothetical protein
MVATLAGSGTAVASHRAAALLHGLDGIDGEVVEISVAARLHPQLPGVTTHRSTPFAEEDVVTVDGIPCTNIARTLCDLGAVTSDDVVEQALDDALRRQVSERWIRETLERVDRPGPSGTHALRRVLARPDRAGALPDSKFERLVERLLTSSILPPPIRQWPVRETGGVRRARLDLAWPDVKLAVEPSGDRFHTGTRRGRQERSRARWVRAEGWELLDAWWDDLKAPEAFVALVERTYLRLRTKLDLQRAHLGTLSVESPSSVVTPPLTRP